MAKAKRNQGRGYLLFTGAMIACCVGLYVAQSLRAAPAEAEPEPTPTPLYHSYPSEDAFLENAAAFGLPAQPEPEAGKLPGSAEYRLAREDMADAYLTLSFREGGVCAFLLRLPDEPAPEKLPKNATPIEADVYQARLEAYAACQAWRQEALPALCTALDPTGSCTAADIARFCALLEETAQTGASREEKAGNLAFTCYIARNEAEGSLICASATRSDN